MVGIDEAGRGPTLGQLAGFILFLARVGAKVVSNLSRVRRVPLSTSRDNCPA